MHESVRATSRERERDQCQMKTTGHETDCATKVGAKNVYGREGAVRFAIAWRRPAYTAVTQPPPDPNPCPLYPPTLPLHDREAQSGDARRDTGNDRTGPRWP